ncbi:hypothetical protein [Yersinia bercovieri]|uniref:hypothetical protein n=1 Tax=Yersinia bercovieri TaxID=634 RepID=UPI001643DF51|nr:hypothetical protein [Yersinia bercovieri]
MGWIGVDLDGTLAEYKTEQKGKIGRPILGMTKRVKKWHQSGKDVRIFTARAETEAGRKDVSSWLKSNGLPPFQVTNIKDSKMVELWDDKAIRVIKNSGNPCPSCKNAHKYSDSEIDPQFFTDC